MEHFRPKAAVQDDDTHGGYWWLAYEFSNYTLSCGECNGPAVKGTRFPLQSGTVARVRFENRHDLNSEDSLLFHPCHDQFDAWFVVDQNGLLHPRLEASPDERARLIAVRQFFRLNLRPELVRARANLWDNCLKLVSAGDYTALRSKAMLPEPHTVVSRTLLRTYAPAHLPLEIDEFDSLLQTLTQDLLIGLTLSSPDERLKKFLKELLYALATAWRFPKGRASAEVEQHLVRWALRDRVKPFFDSLA